MKILIKKPMVLEPDGSFRETDVIIKDDKITHVDLSDDLEVFDHTIDGRGKFLVPGFVNAHTHASMTLLRSYADDLELMTWLNDYIWPIEAKMDREDIYWGAALAAVEMIKSGTTAFADMYGPFMDEVAKIVDESGMRGVLSRGLIGVSPDADEKLAENVELYHNFHGAADGRITVMLGPHAIYTCPPEYLKKVEREATKLGCEIHIHMNETLPEVNDCKKTYGKRPFEVVEESGLFEHGTLAAHCVHLDEEEIEIIERHKIRVAHNPGSNLKLASGICPVTKLQKHGILVALGTDGASSNNNLDMMEEIFLAAMIHKVDRMNPLAVTATEAIQMGTENGAVALGFENVGRIEKGMKADLVLLDMHSAAWTPCFNPVSLLVYSGNSSAVDTVIVDGKILMENRELKTLDEEKVLAEATARAKKLTNK